MISTSRNTWKTAVLVAVIIVSGVGLLWAAPQQEEKGSMTMESEVITLSFYRYSNKAHNMYGIPLLETFQKENPNIKIESVEVSSGGFEALATKVLLGLAAGTPPDVAEAGYTLIKTMVESGSCIPLDSFMQTDPKFDIENLISATLDLGKVSGKQYLMPLGVSTATMFMNTDLFKEVGLDPHNPPKTWKETEQAAQVLKDAGYDGVIWSWTTTGNWIFQTMIECSGGRIANEEATEILFNKQPGVQTMEYLWGLVSKGLMPVTSQVVDTFYTGKIGMIILSSFNRVTIPQTAKFEVLMARIPTPDGSAPKLPAGGKGYMMLATDKKHQQATWEFIRFLSGETAGRIVAENSGYTPVNKPLVESLKKENAGDPNFILTLNQASQVVPWYSWPGENGAKVSKVLSDIQESILLGEVSPKEGLDRAAAEAKKLLQ